MAINANYHIFNKNLSVVNFDKSTNISVVNDTETPDLNYTINENSTIDAINSAIKQTKNELTNQYGQLQSFTSRLKALEGQLAIEQDRLKKAQTQLETEQAELASSQKKLASKQQEYDAITKAIDEATANQSHDLQIKQQKIIYQALAEYTAEEHGNSFNAYLQERLKEVCTDKALTFLISNLTSQSGNVMAELGVLMTNMYSTEEKFVTSQANLNSITENITNFENQRNTLKSSSTATTANISFIETQLISSENTKVNAEKRITSEATDTTKSAAATPVETAAIADTTTTVHSVKANTIDNTLLQADVNNNKTQTAATLANDTKVAQKPPAANTPQPAIIKADNAEAATNLPNVTEPTQAQPIPDIVEAAAINGNNLGIAAIVNNNNGEIPEHLRGKSPLSFDLNGDGVKTSDELIHYDIDGDGTLDRINDSADGILCFDADGNGTSGDTGAECFGNNTDLSKFGITTKFRDGFEALKALAELENLINGEDDNILDENDLKILEDKYGLKMKIGGYNSDAVSLAGLGITGINLATTSETQTQDNFDGRNNQLMTQQGATFIVNGKEQEYADIWHTLY